MGGIFDWLFGALGELVNSLYNALLYIYRILIVVFQGLVYVGKAVVAFLGWVSKAFNSLIKWLNHIWNGMSRLFQKIVTAVRAAQKWLEARLRPVINFLKRVRALYDRYYKTHILPLINFIQRIRKFLFVLRLFHIKFAEALDTKLVKLETRLNQVFLTTRGYLNLALSLASLATNPISLGRFLIVSVAGRRMVGALIRAVTGLPLGHFFPSNARNRFAWEERPMTVRDYTDPLRNPPPSVILAPLLDSFTEGVYLGDYGPTDSDLDATEQIAWGGEYVDNFAAAEDAFDLLLEDNLSIVQALQTQAGTLWNAGDAGQNILATLQAE
jgi:hypothetical protein